MTTTPSPLPSTTFDPAKPFDLSKYGGCSIRNFRLRILDGDDSVDALARATPPGEQVNSSALSTLHTQQLVASAITHVDGEPVTAGTAGYQAWKKWNLRTQEFVLLAYTRSNGITKKEMDSFLAESFGTQPEASIST